MTTSIEHATAEVSELPADSGPFIPAQSPGDSQSRGVADGVRAVEAPEDDERDDGALAAEPSESYIDPAPASAAAADGTDSD